MILVDGKRTRLLVIERDAEVQQLYQDVFSITNCDVAVCSSYEKGIELALTFKPHAVYAGIAFWDKEGKEVCKFLQDLSPPNSTVCVAISGYADWTLEKNVLAAGFHCYFLKPVSFHNLFKPVAAIPGFSDPEGMLPIV